VNKWLYLMQYKLACTCFQMNHYDTNYLENIIVPGQNLSIFLEAASIMCTDYRLNKGHSFSLILPDTVRWKSRFQIQASLRQGHHFTNSSLRWELFALTYLFIHEFSKAQGERLKFSFSRMHEFSFYSCYTCLDF
jgi:hypothetical protein